MDPLSSIKTSSLSLCGISARLKGSQISADKALEECLKFTKDIDNNACLLEAAASNGRKCSAKLAQGNYTLKQKIRKLKEKSLGLEEEVQKINAEKNKLDASLSSLFSDDDEGHNSQQADDNIGQQANDSMSQQADNSMSQHDDDTVSQQANDLIDSQRFQV